MSDGTCGDVVKWLRILGLDTTAKFHNPAPLVLKEAISEDRVLLTRSATIKELGRERVILLPEKTMESLHKLKEAGFLQGATPFTRCLVCNTPLKDIAREEIRDRVPLYIYQTHTEFKICPDCDRIFWSGTHVENMLRCLKNANII